MKSILETRLIHWKKQWFSLLFWLLFPLIASIGISPATDIFKDDTKVPIGIVLEEQTNSAMELYNEIQTTPFIHVFKLSENEALYKLKKHELDSVFIVEDGYEEKIHDGSRNRLITSYQSDLSFAYTPVKEMIISYVQQETGRSKAAYVIQDLLVHYSTSKRYSWQEIVSKSKEIQDEENLLDTTFAFTDTNIKTNEEPKLINIWGLWSVFSILSTFLLFDWVIKEKRTSVIPRFLFLRYVLKNYMIANFIIYSILLLLIDLLTVAIFHMIFDVGINIISLVFFRMLVTISAFLLANKFKHLFLFYTLSFAVTLFISISSGAILPTSGITDRWPWLESFNPIHPFLAGEIANLWLFLVIFLAIIWFVREEKIDA